MSICVLLQVCQDAGVQLNVVPLTEQYWDRVVSHCLAEIRAGRTPNPDVLCNSRWARNSRKTRGAIFCLPLPHISEDEKYVQPCCFLLSFPALVCASVRVPKASPVCEFWIFFSDRDSIYEGWCRGSVYQIKEGICASRARGHSSQGQWWAD